MIARVNIAFAVIAPNIHSRERCYRSRIFLEKLFAVIVISNVSLLRAEFGRIPPLLPNVHLPDFTKRHRNDLGTVSGQHERSNSLVDLLADRVWIQPFTASGSRRRVEI